MRRLGLESLSPEFSEYVADTLDESEETAEDQIPKTTSEIFAAKSKGLTPEQQSKLMLALTILAILISVYQAIQPGRPIKIDPVQFADISSPWP